MNNGWVKFHRKILDKGILRDHTAWVVFSWLLLMVDRETGRRTIGRYQMSDELGIKPNTLYKVLHRLQDKWGAIKLSGQMVFTEITVVNWEKYQLSQMDIMPELRMKINSQSNASQTPVKRSSNPSNTKQEEENKRIKENKDTKVSDKPNEILLTKNQLNDLKRKFPYLDVDRALQKFKAWQHAEGREFKNPLKRFEMWLIDDERMNEKKTNAIIEDPIFKRLLSLYHATEGNEWEAKSSMIDRLNDKYPGDKFKKEWEEAKIILRGSNGKAQVSAYSASLANKFDMNK